MKKEILSGMVAVAIAAVAAVNVNFNNEAEDALSALSLANVEALAGDESGGGGGGGGTGCYTSTILKCASTPWYDGGESKICEFTGIYGAPIECYHKECSQNGYTKKCAPKT